MLFTNGDEKRSSSLAGMFSIALDSFGDSQNVLHVFKSLLVLYRVFLDFCACKKFSIATSSLLVASSAGSNLPTLTDSLYHLVLLTGTSQFFLCLFVCLFVCNVRGQMLKHG